MKQIIKKDKIILTGTFSEVTAQIRLLGLKYSTLKQLLEDYHKN